MARSIDRSHPFYGFSGPFLESLPNPFLSTDEDEDVDVDEFKKMINGQNRPSLDSKMAILIEVTPILAEFVKAYKEYDENLSKIGTRIMKSYDDQNEKGETFNFNEMNANT